MIRSRTLARSLLLALSLLPGLAMAHTGDTQRLRSAIADDQPHAIALLERLVNQNSGSLNLPGVTAVGEMVRAELEPLGFDVQWIDMRATGRAGHLIATHRGNGRGKRVLLIGHLDTVFEPDSPFQRFVRNGDSATGPGIADDKGGVVIIVSALRAMHAAGTLRDADIKVVLTGDEESAGTPLVAARADLVAAGKWADVALEYEELIVRDGQDYATVARRGVTDWELATSGVTGHSGSVFGSELGYGANYELARILDTFRRELPEPNLTFNVGLMVGGTPASITADGSNGTASGKTNIIAAQALARGDLRALTPEQETRARARASCSGVMLRRSPRAIARSATILVLPEALPRAPPGSSVAGVPPTIRPTLRVRSGSGSSRRKASRMRTSS